MRSYRAQEFASLSGVTVRALHHYDRIGLLCPARTENGYRVYRDSDLDRLEQIVALKFLGFPLKQIKVLLERDALEVSEALHTQRRILEVKLGLLHKAIGAIREAESAIAKGTWPDTAALRKIIEVMEMQTDSNWMLKYFANGAQPRVTELGELWTPEFQQRLSTQWRELFDEVEKALDTDPSGAKGQALARRWISLVEELTGHQPDMIRGIKTLYADRANWPPDFQQQMRPFHISEPVWAFITAAVRSLRTVASA